MPSDTISVDSAHVKFMDLTPKSMTLAKKQRNLPQNPDKLKMKLGVGLSGWFLCFLANLIVLGVNSIYFKYAKSTQMVFEEI